VVSIKDAYYEQWYDTEIIHFMEDLERQTLVPFTSIHTLRLNINIEHIQVLCKFVSRLAPNVRILDLMYNAQFSKFFSALAPVHGKPPFPLVSQLNGKVMFIRFK
jgi:hypothetical protein